MNYLLVTTFVILNIFLQFGGSYVPKSADKSLALGCLIGILAVYGNEYYKEITEKELQRKGITA